MQPRLRFQKFNSGWQKQKFNDIFNVVTDYVANGSFKALRDNVTKYTTPNYAYMVRLQDSNNNWKGPWRYTDKRGYNFLKKSKLHLGDIVMSNVGNGTGKTFRIPKLNRPATLAPNSILLKSSNNSETFLYELLILPQTQNKIWNMSTNSARRKINKTDFKKIIVYIPCLSEQRLIGRFFAKLDKLISLQQAKCSLLKKQKKGYLQKLFPAHEKRNPRLRFNGFISEWQYNSLGDIADFVNGKAFKQKDLLNNGKYPVIRVGNFYTDKKIYYSNRELADEYYLDNGDLLYTWSATFGPHIWHGNKVIYHYHIWKINCKSVDKYFLLQLLNIDKNHISKNGSTMAHITKRGMESKHVVIPSIQEQHLIGSFFKQLDDNINLQTKKLYYLRKLKKAYLQKMFC